MSQPEYPHRGQIPWDLGLKQYIDWGDAHASGAGNGVNYVPTNADLPTTAIGHPVLLVLQDSEAGGQASLRYWSGTNWLPLGIAAGGTVNSDFIDVPANIAGIVPGRTLLWSIDQFIPGDLS